MRHAGAVKPLVAPALALSCIHRPSRLARVRRAASLPPPAAVWSGNTRRKSRSTAGPWSPNRPARPSPAPPKFALHCPEWVGIPDSRHAFSSRQRSSHTRGDLRFPSVARHLTARQARHVFASRRKAVLVHGCFWHQHRGCIDSHIPRSNRVYWKPKLSRNMARDAANKRALRRMGWDYLVVRKCQLKDTKAISRCVRRFLKEA